MRNDFNMNANETCDAANAAACEGTHMPVICELSVKNAALIGDINAGMDTMLEILIGAGNAGHESNTIVSPSCLMDDIALQGVNLCEIHAKLSRAIAALRGNQ